MIMNGYQQYKQQSVDTMTSGERLILLFDGGIRHITSAELSLKKGDFEAFDVSVEKTEKIIRYLIATLDMKYDVSKDLYRLYDYFLYLISRIKAGRRQEVITELKEMLFDLRNTFKEADSIALNQREAVNLSQSNHVAE